MTPGVAESVGKFLIGVLSLIVFAFAVGLAWGTFRAGVAVAERWLMP